VQAALLGALGTFVFIEGGAPAVLLAGFFQFEGGIASLTEVVSLGRVLGVIAALAVTMDAVLALCEDGFNPVAPVVNFLTSLLTAPVFSGPVFDIASIALNILKIAAKFQQGCFVVAPSSLSFRATQGGSPPPPQNISLSSVNQALNLGGPLTWSAANTQPWLTLSPCNGDAPSQCTGSTQGTLAVSANVSGMASGTYTDTITITASGQQTSVPVSFSVAPTLVSLTLATQGGAGAARQL
jgi:hypothetical protein